MKITFIPLMLSIVFFFSSCKEANFQRIPEKISGFSGTTLIVFHASWCKYCVKEISLLKELYENYAPCGLNIIGINEDNDESIMNEFIKSQSIPFPVIFWNYELMNKFGNPRALPTNFLLDSLGNVKMRVLGPMQENNVRQEIEKLLNTNTKNCHP